MTTSQTVIAASPAVSARRRPADLAPLAGIGFAVLFVAGVVSSSPPSDSASDTAWIASYTGTAHKAGHIVTGVCLALAGLCLLAFVTALSRRVASHRPERRFSPVPIAAAAVAASCMSVGGVLMGGATTDVSSHFAPNADLLRLCNDLGFAMVGLGAMLAMALCVAVLSAQARTAGFFGARMTFFGYAVAVVLLAAMAFVPIVALLAWCVVGTVIMLRRPAV